jgi:hypothetical protein
MMGGMGNGGGVGGRVDEILTLLDVVWCALFG